VGLDQRREHVHALLRQTVQVRHQVAVALIAEFAGFEQE